MIFAETAAADSRTVPPPLQSKRWVAYSRKAVSKPVADTGSIDTHVFDAKRDG